MGAGGGEPERAATAEAIPGTQRRLQQSRRHDPAVRGDDQAARGYAEPRGESGETVCARARSRRPSAARQEASRHAEVAASGAAEVSTAAAGPTAAAAGGADGGFVVSLTVKTWKWRDALCGERS